MLAKSQACEEAGQLLTTRLFGKGSDLKFTQNFEDLAPEGGYIAVLHADGNGVGRLIVTLEGKLVGIISQRDVMRLFEVKEDLGE